MYTDNVINFSDGLRMNAQKAWERITTQSKMLREDWLLVGQYLLVLRKDYPADQDFGREARKAFKEMAAQHRCAAMWWAELSPLDRSLCAQMWPDINHPQAIRRAFNEMKAEDPEFNEKPVEYSIQPPTLVQQEPETIEIPIELPENEPEPVPEIDENEVQVTAQNISRSPLTPLIGKEGAAAIYRFFSSHHGARIILNRCANKKQAGNLKRFAEMIMSGQLGKINPLKISVDKECRANARFIHYKLSPPLADQFTFSENDVKGFKRLLDAAPILYAVGEQVKHIENRKQRSFEAEKLYRQMTAPVPHPDTPSTTTPPVAAPAPILRRELQRGQQIIKVCGKTYWPPDEHADPELTYKMVWGAGQLVESTYKMLTTKKKLSAEDDGVSLMSSEDAAVSLMMMARAIRMIGRPGGNVAQSMASHMREHPDWVYDPDHSQWPVNSGTPEDY